MAAVGVGGVGGEIEATGFCTSIIVGEGGRGEGVERRGGEGQAELSGYYGWCRLNWWEQHRSGSQLWPCLPLLCPVRSQPSLIGPDLAGDLRVHGPPLLAVLGVSAAFHFLARLHRSPQTDTPPHDLAISGTF